MSATVPAPAWDYRQSVEMVRGIVFRWGRLTLDMISELWTARENLAKPGRPKTGTDDPVSQTWDGYCDDVGISRRTANRWLEQYDPETRELRALPGPEPTPEWERLDIATWYHLAVAEVRAATEMLDARFDVTPGQQESKLHLLNELREKALALAQIGGELNVKAMEVRGK